ncbi:hypothetical protein LAZ67_2006060 [Cordylochernes scorpioides]|uniref:Uncharacterized protein n=1 Tax=Cordylochernes scorpioides TaxID=51811 RepID=A0ABY6K5V5_9ARAC|nr:hypothetical protein LAZ67_2006060 [Cordylochernes scorpioides]
MLNKAFPNDVPKRTTVFEWHYRFKAGRISIEDDPRQGRPKFQRTDENVQKITDLIKENPRTTLLELEQDTGISKTTIGRIVTEDLKLKKTPAKFIPRFLTNEQKLCRLATCEDMMEMTRADPEWKDKIITGDETWVYGYDPETKPQSAEWRDIAPNDFFLFPKLKAVLKGRHFDTRDDIIEKSPLALKSIPKEAYKNCFDNWEKRWRWLDSWGERLESRLSAIDDRVENINQRLQQLEESSAVTKAALSQNSKKIKDLEDQLEHLDAKSRERNLIFYGIEQDNNEDCRERIRKNSSQYFMALEAKLGKACVYQLSKMEGYILVGLSSVKLAERLIEEGLDIGSANLRAFPLRKKAERIA